MSEALNPCPGLPGEALSSMQSCTTKLGWQPLLPGTKELLLQHTRGSALFSTVKNGLSSTNLCFCTLASTALAGTVSAQHTITHHNNRLLFPCLRSQSLQSTGGWWGFAKALTMISKEAPWLERQWRAAMGVVRLAGWSVRLDGSFLLSHQYEEETHLMLLKYSFA